MCISDVRDQIQKRKGNIGPGLTGIMASGQNYAPARPSSRLSRAAAIMPIMPILGVPGSV